MTTPASDRVTVGQLITSSRAELDRIFRAAATPAMSEMLGVVDGSVGSVFVLPDFVPLKKFLNLGWFPWRGKVFEEISATEGKGINRFRIGPFKFLKFHCQTFIAAQLMGANDVYCLNYDLPGNPRIIRIIRDDIKKVDEGLFLGSANMRILGKLRFVAYFILRSTGTRR